MVAGLRFYIRVSAEEAQSGTQNHACVLTADTAVAVCRLLVHGVGSRARIKLAGETSSATRSAMRRLWFIVVHGSTYRRVESASRVVAAGQGGGAQATTGDSNKRATVIVFFLHGVEEGAGGGGREILAAALVATAVLFYARAARVTRYSVGAGPCGSGCAARRRDDNPDFRERGGFFFLREMST